MDDEALAQKVLLGDVKDGEVIVARAFEPLTHRQLSRQLSSLGHDKVKVVSISAARTR